MSPYPSPSKDAGTTCNVAHTGKGTAGAQRSKAYLPQLASRNTRAKHARSTRRRRSSGRENILNRGKRVSTHAFHPTTHTHFIKHLAGKHKGRDLTSMRKTEGSHGLTQKITASQTNLRTKRTNPRMRN